MKKITTLCLAFICILSSCSTDDDQGSNISGDIVGTWIGTGLTYDGTVETSFQGFPITSNFEGEAYDMTNTLTFNESPNTLVSEGSYSLKLTYDFNGVTQTEYVEDVQFLENGTWEIEGNKLIITNNGEETPADFSFVSDDTLVFEINKVEESIVDGLTVVTTIKSIVTFERL
ncbi:lipocalin family protein [Tamlana sp. s12]|uniref:lipocalin family protein n=1 Tax=Tamlana sp. s12 TaxID=1630406 RepID=UPI0007FBB0EA|nr:lipocalin family protein [Tamlana sp. s12]OBQ56586.1 hypothetical protein VQ01_04375 [Tamlana sp. s12]QQY81777.1 lipocalin family protein [Tamlana sp. s12]